MIPLGARVRDTIAGFRGVAVGRTEYLYQAPRIVVRPSTLDDDGTPLADVWVDEGQLVVDPAGGEAPGL